MAATSPAPKKKPSSILKVTLFWAILLFIGLGIYALTSPQNNLKEVALSDVINRANDGVFNKTSVGASVLSPCS